MVPELLRAKRSKKLEAAAPAGTSWCAACQSFRDLEDFGKGATRCRACVSASTHGAMVEKVYGITAAQYDELLRRQGGKCAICRARPKSKRLAVDHDHRSGAVRGLLCSRCNHDLMGSAWDSSSMALALWWYIAEPPTSGAWRSPESGLEAPERRSAASSLDLASPSDERRKAATAPILSQPAANATPGHMLVGASQDENGRYRLYIDRSDQRPPF